MILYLRYTRSNKNITFTAKQVHLLPHFPKLLNNTISVIAFYVKFPPGIAIQATDSLDKTLLSGIVNTSRGSLGQSINKTLLFVSLYFNNQWLTTGTPHTPTKATQTASILPPATTAGLVAGGLLLIIIIIVTVFILRYKSIDVVIYMLWTTTIICDLIDFLM